MVRQVGIESVSTGSVSIGAPKSEKQRHTSTGNKGMSVLRKLLQAIGLVRHTNGEKVDTSDRLDNAEKCCADSSSMSSGSLSTASSFSVLENRCVTGTPGSEGSCDYGTFSAELPVQENISNQVKDLLASSSFCNVFVKDSVAMRIAGDVINLAQNEPCGLRGCRVLVFLDDRGERIALGQFLPEEGLICTFEVIVVLHLKRRGCRSFLPFFSCMPRTEQVNNSYEISKDKLYTCTNSRTPTPVNWQS